MDISGIFATLGTPELMMILVLILLVFGGAQLPKLARSLGRAQREFRTGLSERVEEDTSESSADLVDK